MKTKKPKGKLGGARPGAGRPKKMENKRTKILRQITDDVLASGETLPLEVMLNNMRFYHSKATDLYTKLVDVAELEKPLTNKKLEAERISKLKEEFNAMGAFRGLAQSCAVDAAPFLHARLSSISTEIKSDTNITVTYESKEDVIRELEKRGIPLPLLQDLRVIDEHEAESILNPTAPADE